MKKNIVVKLGSQTIINLDGTLNLKRIKGLIEQIVELEKKNYRVILVSSGAVAMGRNLTSNRKLTFSNDIQKQQVFASLGQAALIEVYNNILSKYDYLASQILITKEDFRSRSHYLNIHRLMQGILNTKMLLPIINENDTTSVQELMFTDNDELSSLVASLVNATNLVILTSVDGVYDKNPSSEDAKIIHNLHLDKEKLWPKLSSEQTLYGRGGILSKIASCKRASQAGIKTHIANAATKNILIRLIDKQEKNLGTTIEAEPRIKGIKKFLAYASEANSSVYVNQGMTDILCAKNKATSILPIGIEKIQGSFSKGDLVSIKDKNGSSLGIGLAEYSSDILQEKIGIKNQRYFMHYNKIYII